MNYSASRSYAFWLALLRLFTGFFWLAHGIPKFTQSATFMPPGGFIVNFLNAAVANTTGPYQQFLTSIVVPNIGIFAELVRLGEVVAGALLFLGFFTRFGGFIGILLALDYLTAKGGINHSSAWTGLDGAAVALSAINLVLPTGRFLGVDGLLFRSRREPEVARVTAPTIAGVRAEFVDEPPMNGPTAPPA